MVYKAEDTRLERTVALKVLAAHLLTDEDAKRRFQREAKAAAALDHSNIATVFEIGEDNGQSFIALQFVDGPTIADKIRERPLPLDEALDIAIQVAEGLQEAHEKGIVHRDIKADNILLNSKGQAKITDFGLAHLAERSKLTKSGTTLGTPAYMSPEQAQGQSMDRRTDIWSLGVMLFEMVTGKHPFPGEYEQAVVYSIVNEQPEPVTALRSGVPTKIDDVILKAMAKDTSQRYPHAEDMLVDLRAIRMGLSGVQPIVGGGRVSAKPGLTAAPRARRIGRLAIAGLAIAVLALAAYLGGWVRPQPPDQTASLSAPIPLTAYPGREIHPSFSPGGEQITFTWEGPDRDNWDIYVKRVGEERADRLTDDPADDFNSVWSPDGRRIAFIRKFDEESAAVMTVPAIGGPARKVIAISARLGTLDSAYRYVTWHPDGRHLIVAMPERQGGPHQLHTVDADTGEARKLMADVSPEGDVDPAVSPDASKLAFRRRVSRYSWEIHIVGITASLEIEGESRRLNSDQPPFFPTWTPDSREIIFASRGAESVRLWRAPAEGGKPEPFRQLSRSSYPAFAASGRLALSYVIRDFDTWELQLATGEKRRAISSTFFDVTPQYSPDGSRIAFSSSRSGYREIWLSDRDGSNPIQLTNLKLDRTSAPYWSPDGSWIAFQCFDGDQWDIFVIRASGGEPRNLTDHPAFDGQPTVSRDGRQIYFSSNRSGEYGIWRIAPEGGEPVQVTSGGNDRYALESVNGRTLYYSDLSSLWIIPVAGGPRTLVVERFWSSMSWAVGRSGIYFTGSRNTPRTIDFYDFDSKAVSSVMEFEKETFSGFSLSPDGESILYTQGEPPESDIMLVEDFR